MNWTAFGAISSCVLSALALGVAIVSFRNANRVRRRTDLRTFLEESAYAADRLEHDMLRMLGPNFDKSLVSIDQVLVEQLLRLRSRAAPWPAEPFLRSLDRLIAAVGDVRRASERYRSGQEDFRRWVSDGGGRSGEIPDSRLAGLQEEVDAWAETTSIADRLSAEYSYTARAKLAAL